MGLFHQLFNRFQFLFQGLQFFRYTIVLFFKAVDRFLLLDRMQKEFLDFWDTMCEGIDS